MSFVVGTLINRYILVITFPTFVAAAIYADYTHTQKWKKEKKQT